MAGLVVWKAPQWYFFVTRVNPAENSMPFRWIYGGQHDETDNSVSGFVRDVHCA
jgi:hypothetical protein